MRIAWSALSPLALAALVIGGTVALWKLNHQEDLWPPIDRTARYSYCQLEDQVYLRVVDRNAYVILENTGPYVALRSEVDRALTKPEYAELMKLLPDLDAYRNKLETFDYRYDLSKPDFEIAIPFKENPYRWRPSGRESMHDCYSRMTGDATYMSKVWVARLH